MAEVAVSHIGRSSHDTRLEDVCPCPKERGLVADIRADPECLHHPMMRARTLRQVHAESACPGAAGVEPGEGL